jgi:hypothetical protein
MVTTQRSLEHPLGAVLARLGQRPPKTMLQDPHAVLRAARLGKKILPRLPRAERWLMSARAAS